VTHRRHADLILIAASGFTYGPNSSNNLGDRAQLTRSVQRLRAAFPSSRLVAIANSLNDESDFDDLEVSYSAIRYLTSAVTIPIIRNHLPVPLARAVRVFLLLLNARLIRREKRPIFLSEPGRIAVREMHESAALFMSGAGAFNDLYMSGAGGFWGVLARCMHALKKPVVASGQQIGPFRRLSRRALAKWALRPIELLGVREPLSAASALAVGLPEHRVVLTGDDAWDLAHATGAVVDAVLTQNAIPEAFIAAQVRFGPSVGWDEADSQSLALSLDQLSAEVGLPVVFVPCMTGLGADDRYSAAAVRAHLRARSWVFMEGLDAQTTKSVLGRAVLGIGTANHFCVFAASAGTSVVGLYATPYMEQKMRGLAELWPKRVAALSKDAGLNPQTLVAAARHLLETHDGRNGEADPDQPSVELHPSEPIRYLAREFERTPRPSYRDRFIDRAAVKAYDQEFASDRFMANLSVLESHTLRTTLTSLSQKPFKRHLDFACGTGRAISFMRGFAEGTVGVDVSPHMLEYAQKRFPETRFVCGDVSTDPRLLDPLGRFDLVTLWRFIAPADPHLRLAALSAIARSMNDGALLLVNNNANRTSLHWVALLLRALMRRESLQSSGAYQGSMPHRQLERLLLAVGLRVEAIRGISYLPDQLARRRPAWLWMAVDQVLRRLNFAPQYAVNQLVIARRDEQTHPRTHLSGYAGVVNE
jgi:polysaccharide pyruvyl transferase WcaK-like protein/SAM-dependent methyltransferase